MFLIALLTAFIYFTVSVQICLVIDGLYVILVMVCLCMLLVRLRLSSSNKCLLTYFTYLLFV